MANKMLIDATHPEETRVVVLRGNRVEEFDFETAQRKQLRGNIYLAKVTRVEPSLQAAFVDYGGNRHGFLAFSEIHPDYYQIPVADRQALIDAEARAARDEDEEQETRGRRASSRNRRHRSMRSERSDETVQGEALAGDEPAPDAAEIPTGDAAEGDAARSEFASDPAAEPPVPFEASPQPLPVGESANPPVPGEVASVYEPGQPESREPAQPQLVSAEPQTFHSERPDPDPAVADSEMQDGPASVEEAPPADVGLPATAAPELDTNGGADEEEEVVDTVGGADALEEVLERAPRYRRQYKIQEVIKRRQVMLVQVVKEERGTKGAALTTYLSLAGRYCVLMPNTARGGGISRKITSAEDRKKLREIAEELEVPEGMGVILRTAGAARTKAEVKRDFEYLLRLWEQVRDLTLRSTAPTLVYEEGSLAKRSIRDLYAKDIDEIIVAGEQGYKDAKEFMRMLMPSHAKNVKLYRDSQPVFTRYGIESQLDAMFSPTVQLRSGGYIVINQTEALVSIDVNSGRSTREHHIEDTALKTNIEAAEEIARQLRLRDLAGLIVIDFIDMDEKRNNRTVERRLKDALRNDRARIQVGRISHFGLLEMSRQRIRTSVLESSTEKCLHCGGTGHMRSVSSVALQLLRSLEEALLKGATHNQIVRTRPDIALYVLNHKRAHLRALEERFQISITINADAEVGGQTGFTIERGEQVHTLDQARALLAKSETAPAAIEEEEPATPEDFEELEEAEEDAGEQDEQEARESFAGEPQPAHAEGENGREGGRGRRRRRRRGRGRGGEGREHGPPIHRDEGMPGHAEFAPEAGAAMTPPGSHEPAPVEGEPQHGEPRAAEHRESGDGYVNGDGERRRRRRGRRGGRKNRRDREGHGQQGEFAAAATDSHEAQPHEPWHEPAHETWRQPREERPQWTEPSPAPVPDNMQEGSAPRAERPAETQPERQPELAAHEPPSATPEPPRRRSTVREPAPVFGTSAPVVTPMPTPQPPAPPPDPEPAAEDESRPRRTGWWSRRLMGGDKG